MYVVASIFLGRVSPPAYVVPENFPGGGYPGVTCCFAKKICMLKNHGIYEHINIYKIANSGMILMQNSGMSCKIALNFGFSFIYI